MRRIQTKYNIYIRIPFILFIVQQSGVSGGQRRPKCYNVHSDASGARKEFQTRPSNLEDDPQDFLHERRRDLRGNTQFEVARVPQGLLEGETSLSAWPEVSGMNSWAL